MQHQDRRRQAVRPAGQSRSRQSWCNAKEWSKPDVGLGICLIKATGASDIVRSRDIEWDFLAGEDQNNFGGHFLRQPSLFYVCEAQNLHRSVRKEKHGGEDEIFEALCVCV